MNSPLAFGSPLTWAAFVAFVLVMLALDLGVFHRRESEMKPREALLWTGFWIALALLFDLGVYFWSGSEHAVEFVAGYFVEKALSVDNLFVILLVFSSFAVPPKLQHRVLAWGILGALVMRGAFILLGAELLHRFHWISYGFGALLVFTALRMLRQDQEAIHPDRNPLVRLARRVVPVTSGFREGRFTVVEQGRRMITPLLLALLTVESTDAVFAVDSIPAIFGITEDPFVVFTSNVFALLGLRSLYFALAGVMYKFHYLKHGLALLLAFVGVKMLLARVVHLPVLVSLGVIVVILGGAIGASLLWPPSRGRRVTEEPSPHG